MNVLGKNEPVARAHALADALSTASTELIGMANMHYFYAMTDIDRLDEPSILSTMGAMPCTIIALTLADGRAALGHFDGSMRGISGDTVFANAVQRMIGVFGDGVEIEDLVLSATYLAVDDEGDDIYHQDPTYDSILDAIAGAVNVQPRWIHLVEGRDVYEWYDRAVLLPQSQTLLLFGSEEGAAVPRGQGHALEVHKYG